MNSRAVSVWRGVAICLLSGCSAPASCPEGPQAQCQTYSDQIQMEDAAHPEFNPNHVSDVCAADLPHYAAACATLQKCLDECQ